MSAKPRNTGKWVLCPVLTQHHMNPGLSIPKLLRFSSNEKARQAPEQQAGQWLDPLPVRLFEECDGPRFKGPWFSEGRQQTTSLLSHRKYLATSVGDAVRDQILPLRCFLGDDWDFLKIEGDARKGRGHVWEGLDRPVLDHLILVICDLENALRRRHQVLSAAALYDFWRSWQVHLHVAQFCRRSLFKDWNEYELEQARNLADRQLSAYAWSIEPLDRTSGNTGPRPRTDDHEKLVRIVEPYGSSWKEERNLSKICSEADRQKVFVPQKWRVSHWRGGLRNNRDKVLKVIEWRLKSIGQLPSSDD
jgi:hypothetical protein